MRPILQPVIALVLVAMLATSLAAAQGFGVGGGLIAPLSEYKATDNLGWHVMAKVESRIGPGSPVGIRVDALYGQTNHKSGQPIGHTRLIGALANGVFHVTGVSQVKPYVMGGAGFYNVQATAAGLSGSTTKFSWDVGGGLGFGAGQTTFFVEARYVTVTGSITLNGSALKFIPVTVGLTF